MGLAWATYVVLFLAFGWNLYVLVGPLVAVSALQFWLAHVRSTPRHLELFGDLAAAVTLVVMVIALLLLGGPDDSPGTALLVLVFALIALPQLVVAALLVRARR